jgi:hypothetical protein
MSYSVKEKATPFRHPGPFTAVIDSNRPYMYLPKEICSVIEKDLQLSWDTETEHYLISDEIHTQLKKNNPILTFELSSNNVRDNGPSFNISLPYNSLNLRLINFPRFNVSSDNESRYFPMKPATEGYRLTLGRAFLQEAYLITDYENKEFRVHQVDWRKADEREASIETILPKGHQKRSLGQAAIAGITSACTIVLLVLILLLIYKWRNRPRKIKQEDEQTSSESTSSTSQGDMLADRVPEVESNPVYELGGGTMPEMAAQFTDDSRYGVNQVVELDSIEPEVVFHEMECNPAPMPNRSLDAKPYNGTTRINDDPRGRSAPARISIMDGLSAPSTGLIAQTSHTRYERGFHRFRDAPELISESASYKRPIELYNLTTQNIQSAQQHTNGASLEVPYNESNSSVPASPIPKTPLEYYGLGLHRRNLSPP